MMIQSKSEMDQYHKPKHRLSRKSSSQWPVRKADPIVSVGSMRDITKETEETFLAVMDLLSDLPAPEYSSSSQSSGSSDASTHFSFTRRPSNQQHLTPESTPTSSSSKSMREFSPRGPNFLQISHDGRVRAVLSTSPTSAFLPIVKTQHTGEKHSPRNEFVLGCNEHGGFKRENNNDNTIKGGSHESYDSQGPCMATQEPRASSKAFIVNGTELAKRSRKKICAHVVSSLFFAVGASLYVTKAFLNVNFYSQHRQVPNDVLYADDDITWWWYYNITSSTPISPHDWQTNNRPFLNDDYVFKDTALATVGKNQLICFLAAFNFLMAGFLQLLADLSLGDGPQWKTAPYGVMVVGGLFGIASSIIMETDGQSASLLNAVSAHLFSVQAILLIVFSCKDEDENDIDETDKISEGTFAKDAVLWTHMANVCFLLGALIDVFLCYFIVHASARLSHAYAGLVSSTFWLLSSTSYLSVAIREFEHHDRSHTDKESSSTRTEGVVVLKTAKLPVVAMEDDEGLPP
jgi:hypothetical protein